MWSFCSREPDQEPENEDLALCWRRVKTTELKGKSFLWFILTWLFYLYYFDLEPVRMKAEDLLFSFKLTLAL